MTTPAIFVNATKVELIDSMGSDLSVVNAARVSFAKSNNEFVPTKDGKLLKYLAKHGHWSPFAHTSITVRCSVPIFLARQLVKHQVGLTLNEESRRYIDTPVKFYMPPHLHYRPTNSKQGRGDMHDDIAHLYKVMKESTEEAYKSYNLCLQLGVAPEEARMVLPLNSMTNFYWTGSLMAFARVVQQRSTTHAQLIANEFAEQLADVLREVYPESFKALLEANVEESNVFPVFDTK